MRVGVTLPNLGPSANAHAIIQGAQHAERLGYDSLWVVDRLLYPVKPRSPYAGTPDGSLPEFYQQVLDPLESLTFAAAHPSRIALGTSILDIPFYHPVVLARRLTTLDVLSGGRLRVGYCCGVCPHDAAPTRGESSGLHGIDGTGQSRYYRVPRPWCQRDHL